MGVNDSHDFPATFLHPTVSGVNVLSRVNPIGKRNGFPLKLAVSRNTLKPKSCLFGNKKTKTNS